MDKKRILIGEDDPSILKMTKLRLEFEGFDVVGAADGEEVLHQAEAQLPVHCILLDVKLPKMNGYDVCRTLKRSPPTAGIPVIIFTASEEHLQHLADRCIEIGASDWIRKPFRAKDLLEKIRRVLEESLHDDAT